jgi:predicted small lipoprotein YifL
MRLNIALGIIVALALPLQGCGKKGPLTLPPSQPQATGSQTPDSQTPVPQAPDTSAPGQNKQP